VIWKNQSNANVASQSNNSKTSLNRNETNLNRETNIFIGTKQSMKSRLKKVLLVKVEVQQGLFAQKSKKRLR
jgi:hypothetical protein